MVNAGFEENCWKTKKKCKLSVNSSKMLVSDKVPAKSWKYHNGKLPKLKAKIAKH